MILQVLQRGVLEVPCSLTLLRLAAAQRSALQSKERIRSMLASRVTAIILLETRHTPLNEEQS